MFELGINSAMQNSVPVHLWRFCEWADNQVAVNREFALFCIDYEKFGLRKYLFSDLIGSGSRSVTISNASVSCEPSLLFAIS